MTSRTMTTAKGRTITTDLTDAEAIALCAKLPSTFARDLAQKERLSPDQLTWAHILAVESKTPKAPALQLSADSMQAIADLFGCAAAKLQYPKIRLQVDGQDVALIHNRAKQRINVTDGRPYGENVYFGYIDCRIGDFMPARACTDAVKQLLKDFADDPAGVAAEYGRATGNCCFCARELTDPRSLEVGYGPICSENYGLPWGAKALAA